MLGRRGRGGSEAVLGVHLKEMNMYGNPNLQDYNSHHQPNIQNMPSGSFYNNRSHQQIGNGIDPNSNSNRSNNPLFNKKIRKSNMSMKRVDKISRVSVDKSKKRASKNGSKTNFHGIFDAIMNNNSSNRSALNNRSQRNKSGLLSRGFMPNKSKGSLGALMGRDRSVGGGLGRKNSRGMGKRNLNSRHGNDEGASKAKFGLDIFGPKRSVPKRRAYFD